MFLRHELILCMFLAMKNLIYHNQRAIENLCYVKLQRDRATRARFLCQEVSRFPPVEKGVERYDWGTNFFFTFFYFYLKFILLR